MSNTPRLPDPESLPHLTRRSLVVHWDTAANEVWMDSSGLSVFDVSGLLRVALDIAEMGLPTEDVYPESEEEDDQ
jgi:hypothetical protein